MKRFYTLVSTQEKPDGFGVALDGKPIKTPNKVDLVAPSEALADAIVQEWAAQGDEIIPDSMPLMQLLSTQIDRVSRERAAMTEGVLKYLNTDLICYYADYPPELVEKQRAIWRPVQAWFEERFGVELEITDDIRALSQPEGAHKGATEYVEKLDAAHFTALQVVTPLSGSLILAIALVEGQIDAEQVFAAMRVEESHKAIIYNEEKYGPDPAAERKDEAAKVDLHAAQLFLELIRRPG